MSKQLIIASHKGGVNKSTITSNLAIGLVTEMKKIKVLVVDTDPQANLSKKFLPDFRKENGLYELLKGEDIEKCIHQTKYNNLDLIPSKQKLSVVKREILLSIHGIQQQRLMSALKPIMDRYDYILFDTAPGLDIMTLNVLQFLNKDGLLIIPVIPDSDSIGESDSIEGMNLLLDEISESIKAGEPITPNFKVLLTEVDNDEVSKIFKEMTKDHFGNRAFVTEIPFSSRNARRKENFEIEKTRTRISRAFKKLVIEIAGDING